MQCLWPGPEDGPIRYKYNVQQTTSNQINTITKSNNSINWIQMNYVDCLPYKPPSI